MGSVAELRNLFEKRLQEGIPIPPGKFHPKDLERIQDDAYLERVLAQCKYDLANSSKALWNIIKWRATVSASDINESNIRMEYVNTGTFYPHHGRDIDGCKILVFKCKNYSRSRFEFEDVKKIVIYWLDRTEREEHGKKVTLFFDLDEASLSNFDTELIRYLIDCFYNYPSFLDKIVVYQLPWLLTATFKLVKKLLPADAVDIMRLASKQTVLKEIVNPDQALTSWGGTNEYEFKFTPEKKNNKRVSFATTTDRPQSIISTMSVDDTAEHHQLPNDTNETILNVEPKDRITFENENEEIIGYVKITNTTETTAAFKVRTTGPEKFWVRPSSGVLLPKKSERISITILPGYQKTALRDRFLIMATPVDTNKIKIDQTDLTEAWRVTSKTEVEEHRLKCNYIEKVPNKNAYNDVKEMPDATKTALEELKRDVNSLKSQVADMKVFLYLSIVLGIMTVLLGVLLLRFK